MGTMMATPAPAPDVGKRISDIIDELVIGAMAYHLGRERNAKDRFDKARKKLDELMEGTHGS
jgi:hypothetical protein